MKAVEPSALVLKSLSNEEREVAKRNLIGFVEMLVEWDSKAENPREISKRKVAA